MSCILSIYRACTLVGSDSEYAFNLHPDITTLGSAYLDVLEAYSWKTITILYQVHSHSLFLSLCIYLSLS